MLGMSGRPSDLMGDLDEYTAFCFDEAVAHILKRMQDGEKPKIKEKEKGKKIYSKPSELYKKYM